MSSGRLSSALLLSCRICGAVGCTVMKSGPDFVKEKFLLKEIFYPTCHARCTGRFALWQCSEYSCQLWCCNE
jgi:hypothetical protein